ncbi:MAG TPA: CARDB domain-containing protein [Acidobacteriota bacterium]|nr:CARDB domain-containing protein [Acidobacteriota bacterium]
MRYCFLFLLCSTLCYASSDLELKDLKQQVSEDGKILDLQFILSNHGPDDASAIGLRLHFLGNHKELSYGEYELQPLAHDTERAGNLQAELPASVNGIRVEVYDAAQADVKPTNNVLEADLKMPGSNLADLEIQDGSIVSAQPVQDRNLILRIHVVNHGPAAITNSRAVAELMLFQKTVSSAERRPGRLAAGEERDVQFSIPIPADVPTTEGIVMIHWTLDDDAVQDASNGHNTYSIAVSLVARQPDLVLQDVRVNSRGELSFTVKNVGNAPAGETTTALYVNAALVKRYKTPALRPGAERQHQYGGTKIVPGTQITIVADFNADIAESSEANNRYQFVSK